MKAAKRFKTQERVSEREREREREREINLARKKVSGNRTKKCFEEEIADAPFESNTNTAVVKHLIRNYTC